MNSAQCKYVKHQFIKQIQSNAYQYNRCLAEQKASLEVVHTTQRLTKSVNKTPKNPFCNIVITSVNGKTGTFIDQFFV